MSNDHDRLRTAVETLRNRPVAAAPFVGGRPCLDFANTVAGWEPEGASRTAASRSRPADRGSPTDVFVLREERLREYADLLAWAQRAGLLEDAALAELWRQARLRRREATAVVGRARRLRHAIYRTAWRVAHGQPPVAADLDVMLSEVQAARRHERLQVSGHGLAWVTVADPRALDRVLWPVAQSAATYFTTADLSRLRVCPGDECGWVFEDTSRNRSRRWCEMADCGNLDKVRRFRSRSHGPRRRAPGA